MTSGKMQGPFKAQVVTKAQRFGYFFFFTSGAAALIYEVIWVRLLGFVFGNTTHAVSAVLTAYMAGLGFGSYWISRRADRFEKPLFVYGLMEIGIGVYAAWTFVLLQFIQNAYTTIAITLTPGPALFAFIRLALSFLILFPPCFFMGATLPVLVKFYVHEKRTIGSGTALLYGLNTAGAVVGTVLAGFSLLPFFGLKASLQMAVVINIGIGLLACVVSRELELAGLAASATPVPQGGERGGVRGEGGRAQERGRDALPSGGFSHLWLPAGLGISGILAMVYEVGWTRILAAVLGSSTYAFTLMLSTFLLGIALGSALAKDFLARRPARVLD